MTSAARISSASFESEFSNEAAVPWKSACKLGGKFRFLADLVDVVDGRAQRGVGRQVEGDRDRRELALVIDGERFGGAVDACVKALRGTAFALTAEVAVFGVLPASFRRSATTMPNAVPRPWQMRVRRALPRKACIGPRWSVHWIRPRPRPRTRNEVAAPAPLAPDEALDWM